MTWALLLFGVVAAAQGETEPSAHTLVYYNARMALREGQPLEAVKLWLLRNALEDRTGTVSSHDPDFRSVTWAALGALGICQDGYPTDEDGADLWRLALHNWVVRNMGRRPVKGPKPFEAFKAGRQARAISITDVLGADELRAVHLSRGECLRPRLLLLGLGEAVNADLSDRAVAARLLLHLLEEARASVPDEQVRGWAAVDARVFDLRLQVAALAAREARQEARDEGRQARAAGLSRESIAAMRAEAPATTLDPESSAGRVLRASVDWPVSEWMALSSERRLFLFDQARAFGGDPDAMRGIALGIVDRLIEDGAGAELEPWIARAATEAADRRVIWGGERGQRLLALDRESGFRERAVIALPRGVHRLEQGDLAGALRAMAFALQQAPDSRASQDVHNLALRWLSYTATRFESTDELLVTLQELVPSRDYAVLLEDLMWRAAFHADRASFERGMRNQVGRGALERRLGLLQPLARGDANGFASRIRAGLAESTSETLRFLDQMVERLELEEAEVRAAHVGTLTRVRELVRPLSDDTGSPGSGRQGRTAAALMERTQAILQGEGLAGGDARDRARSLDPTGEVFAGSVRLAPADPFPWPFQVSDAPAPSVFVPLDLTPVEWREDGELVFGWRISG